MNVIIGEIQALLTPDEFARFLAHYAGTNVTFQTRRSGVSFAELAGVVGDGPATALCDTFAPSRVYVARDAAHEHEARNAEIRQRLAAGESTASIARSYRYVATLSVRTVRRIAAEMSKEGNDNRGIVGRKAVCESR